MVNIGVIGLGSMGNTHLEAYGKIPGCRVVAVADADAGKRTGRTAAGGNIEGQGGGGFDFSKVRPYADAGELIADVEVDLVDVCLPTPLHERFAVAALQAGKHLLVEKPLARTAEAADRIAAAADEAARDHGAVAMCAMCMRFWPAWVWLKEAIDDDRFGRVRAAQFRRVSSHPGAPFYADGDASGGALLDLHVHDTDFVRFAFGEPEAVFSRGYSAKTSEPDHVFTHYLYGGNEAPVVTAEGGWVMQQGFPFTMQFCVNFERATAVFDLSRDPQLTLIEAGDEHAVEVHEGMGYQHELAYLVGCIERGEQPTTVTLADAAASLRLVEAEGRSIASGGVERVAAQG